MGILAASMVGPATAAPPLESVTDAAVFTQTPLRLTVDSQRLDKTIESIFRRLPDEAGAAKRPNFNRSGWTYWLDRHVDPSQTVSLKQAGPTAAAVLQEMADQLGLACFPLPHVLLIGRPEWVRQTLATVQHSPAPDLVTWRWPRGTPAVAIMDHLLPGKLTNGPPKQPADGSWFPHDIWRSGGWCQVDRRMAVCLMLAQFDLALAPTASLRQLRLDAAERPSVVTAAADYSGSVARFPIAYPAGPDAISLRDFARRLRPPAQVRSTAQRMVVTASAAGHLRLLHRLWLQTRPPADASAPPMEDPGAEPPTFDLRLINRPALDVLSQLAATAGKKIEVTEDAKRLGSELVTLEAKQQTLQSLSFRVAEEVGLAVRWNEKTVEVTVAKDADPSTD